MRRCLAAFLSLLIILTPPATYADSLSITTWQTGDSLNSVNLNSRMNSISTWANGLVANDNIKSTAAIVGSKLDLTSGTGRFSNSTSVTSDAPLITSEQTWNNAAGVFSGWRLNIVNTNSASTSRLLDLQVGNTVIASISRVGQLVLNSQNYASGPRTLMDGAWFNIASATYTDNITAARGTAPRFIAYAFQRPAVAAGNSSVTTTDAATVFIASAPVAVDNMTLTRRHALWIDQGNIRIGGSAIASSGLITLGSLTQQGSQGVVIADGEPGLQINSALNKAGIILHSWSSSAVLHAGSIFFARSRSGTIGTYTETNADDQLGEIEYFGTDNLSTPSEIAAAMRVYQEGAAANGRVGARFVWEVGTNTQTATEQMRLTPDGALILGASIPSAGLGAGMVVTPNNAGGYYGANAAGTQIVNAIRINGSNQIVLAAGGAPIRWGVASSTTGSATATLGTNAPVGQTTPYVWISVVA
mgnify:FL=1